MVKFYIFLILYGGESNKMILYLPLNFPPDVNCAINVNVEQSVVENSIVQLILQYFQYCIYHR